MAQALLLVFQARRRFLPARRQFLVRPGFRRAPMSARVLLRVLPQVVPLRVPSLSLTPQARPRRPLPCQGVKARRLPHFLSGPLRAVKCREQPLPVPCLQAVPLKLPFQEARSVQRQAMAGQGKGRLLVEPAMTLSRHRSSMNSTP